MADEKFKIKALPQITGAVLSIVVAVAIFLSG
jgi:hypothetical protein